MGPGDRRQDRHIGDHFRDAETGPPGTNAAEPRAFRVLVRNQLGWLAGAGGFELRMAESKSSYFRLFINVRSEKSPEFDHQSVQWVTRYFGMSKKEWHPCE